MSSLDLTMTNWNNTYNPLRTQASQAGLSDLMPFINEGTGTANPVIGVTKQGTFQVPDPVLAPNSSFYWLNRKRDIIQQSARQRPLIRLWDKDMNPIATLANEMSASVEEIATDSGTAHFTIRRDEWLTDYLLTNFAPDEDLNITMDPVPTQRNWRTRWGGKVSALSLKRSAEGLHTVELEAISNREHLKHILLGANPIFPPEVQLPKMWFLPGNNCTINSLSLLINLARLQFPALSLATNIFNPASWLGSHPTGWVDDWSPLNWALQVAFINPFLDQSRFTFLGARWTDTHTATKDNNNDAGCIWRAYTWLTEDVDSPHTQLANLGSSLAGVVGDLLGMEAEHVTEEMINAVIRPTRNCVVFSNENVSGIGGPTGTAVDGVINLVGVTADDSITEFLYDVNEQDYKANPTNGNLTQINGPLFAKWLGVAPGPPDVVFRDTEYSGIVEASRVIHKAQARTTMVGGKSPAWVNQLITFGIRYGISQIAQVILGYENPGVEGLDNIYQGQLDDVFLAYQRYTNPMRVLRSGSFAFQEHFEQGGGTAYTTSGILTLRQGDWKTRPYQTFKATVLNGQPWVYGIDFTLGERLGFEIDKIIHVDNLHAVKYEWSRQQALKMMLSIGSDVEEQDPTARAMRVAENIWGMLGMALGSQSMF